MTVLVQFHRSQVAVFSKKLYDKVSNYLLNIVKHLLARYFFQEFVEFKTANRRVNIDLTFTSLSLVM